MMKKKLITLNLLIVLAMLVTALTGCAQAPGSGSHPGREQPAAQQTEAPQATGPVADFVTWSYGVETIADNIKKFQEIYPDISVTHKDTPGWIITTPWSTVRGREHARVALRSDHWLQEWASLAGSNRPTTTART
jgi:hypothetical protein